MKVNNILSVILALGLITGCWSAKKTDDPELLKKVLTSYFEGIESKDFAKMKAATTDDFILYEDGAVWNNDSVFVNIKAHLPFTVKYKFDNFKIHVDNMSGDMTYFNHADFVFNDTTKKSIDWIESATFRKNGGVWRMNFLQATISVNQNIAYDTILYQNEHYLERVAIFNSEPVIKDKIIFLGNSITEFKDWQQLLNDPGVINRGIAGDNTYGVLARLKDIINRQPRKLFIEIGINDISLNISPKTIVKNILTIVEQVHAKSPETKIYVHSILPANDNVKNEYPGIFNKNKQVDFINNQLKINSKDNKYIYIDLNKMLKDKNGKLDLKYAMPDGLHLNNLGYSIWANLLKTKKYL